MGEVAFSIKIFQNFSYHRNQHSKEQWLFNFHPIKPLNSSVFRLLKFGYFKNLGPLNLSQFKIYITKSKYKQHSFWTIHGSQFSKTLNFNERKTLESAVIFAWKLKSHCFFGRWFRWYQWFLKILIYRILVPYMPSAIFRLWHEPMDSNFVYEGTIFDAEHDDPKIFQIFENFGKSRNQFWDSPITFN